MKQAAKGAAEKVGEAAKGAAEGVEGAASAATAAAALPFLAQAKERQSSSVPRVTAEGEKEE